MIYIYMIHKEYKITIKHISNFLLSKFTDKIIFSFTLFLYFLNYKITIKQNKNQSESFK